MESATQQAQAAPKTSTVRLGFIIDESGSMGGLVQAVTDGYNEFVGALKQEENAANVWATCGFFDSPRPFVRYPYSGQRLPDVQPLGPGDYRPGGGTPLNDSLIELIRMLEHQSADAGERVMVVVMTDGYENASEDDRHGDVVRRLVAQKENEGWEFIYMGAKIDAFAGAQAIGMSGKAGSYMNFAASATGTANTFRAAGLRSSAYTGSDPRIAAQTYAASAGSTPVYVSPHADEFAKQAKELADAQEKAKEDALKQRNADPNSPANLARAAMRASGDPAGSAFADLADEVERVQGTREKK